VDCLPPVRNSARDTLGNEDAVTLGEIASSASVALLSILAAAGGLLVLHGVDTAHATVGLNELTLAGHERSTGRLGGTGQETAHHDGRGAEGETLDDVANVLDTTIGDAGDAEAGGKSADLEDGGGLGTANSHDLLGNAGATAAHADAETIDTGGNEGGCLFPGNDVTADDLEVGVCLLDPLDHLDLVDAVALTAVQDDDIETSLNEESKAVLIGGTSANGGSAEELLGVGLLRSQGEVEVLGQIGARDHRDEVSLSIDDRQLALLGLSQDFVGLLESDAGRGSDQVSDHDLADRLVKIFLELDIPVGDNAQELGAKLAGLCWHNR